MPLNNSYPLYLKKDSRIEVFDVKTYLTSL